MIRQTLTLSEQEIVALLKQKNAALIAHYYTDDRIQFLAEYSGGCVADSLEMARFGAKSSAEYLIVAGVYFMGETAKILSPDKTVSVIDSAATCSLDLGCPIDEFLCFKEKYPDRKVVVYANTSAAIKAESDWVVTSRNAIDIVSSLSALGEKILWAPDKYLGDFIQKKTNADMVLWDGSCIVHEEFKADSLRLMKRRHSDACVLVHPESPAAVIEQADVVGSTSILIEAVETRPEKKFIVATDMGIFYKMRQLAPDKELIVAPTGGQGATCKSCGKCPWMAMNNVEKLLSVIKQETNKVTVLPEVAKQAKVALDRMVNFTIAN